MRRICISVERGPMTIVRPQSVSATQLGAPAPPMQSQRLRSPLTKHRERRVQVTDLQASPATRQGVENGFSEGLSEPSSSNCTALRPLALTSRSSAHEHWVTTAALLLLPLATAGPALAYNRSEGEQIVKNVAGGAYLILVCLFFVRLLRKRAMTGTTQSFRSSALQEPEAEAGSEAAPAAEEREVTPAAALWGSAQAGIICFLLFQLCGLVDGYFSRQELPDQFTARNITVTLRTIIRGLAYLVTFLFGANCAGLTGLAMQLLFFPDRAPQVEGSEREKQS